MSNSGSLKIKLVKIDNYVNIKKFVISPYIDIKIKLEN
jgi:hypothetical protein